MYSYRNLGALAAAALAALALTTATPAGDQKNPAATPSPRKDKKGDTDAGWVKRHEGFVALAKKGDVNVLFLGDSITDGWRFDKGKAAWEKYFASMKAANFGIGGDRTEHVLWRLQNGELDGIHPKVVVLMIGTNNVPGKGYSAEDIADGVKAIVKTIQEKSKDTKVLLLAVFPRDEKADTANRKKIAEVNKVISKLDDGGKTVLYMDIGQKFLQQDGTLTEEIMYDRLHLTNRGYEIWGDAIADTVRKLAGAEDKK
jgi:lysophospholipase L1-like esterase